MPPFLYAPGVEKSKTDILPEHPTELYGGRHASDDSAKSEQCGAEG